MISNDDLWLFKVFLQLLEKDHKDLKRESHKIYDL